MADLSQLSAENGSPSFLSLGNTVRCVGQPMFRTVLAQDMACLLDVDPGVSSWRCLPMTLGYNGAKHVPDFETIRRGVPILMDAVPAAGSKPPAWARDAARAAELTYETMREGDIRGCRLANARDLLSYAHARVAFGDRIRVLATLDEDGSMPIVELARVFRETEPIAGIASLVLHRDVEVDLDARLGPETLVRRLRA